MHYEERAGNLERTLYTAKLTRKLLLSESAQCYHLEFLVEELPRFDFLPGQFVSMVADDSAGKTQTRAYSVASAPRGNEFDLCADRVKGGFFSNLLCDLEVGQTVRFHGPYGYFVLRQPLTDSILIATGTGIAPMRGFAQVLFPESGPHAGEDRSEGREFWLVYGTRHVTEFYYHDYFQALANEHPNFHYIPTLSRPGNEWQGARGYVQEHVGGIVTKHAAKRLVDVLDAPLEEGRFDIHAYICGLNEMVAANREALKGHGWHRKQIVFERYD